jgi:hypothetical protein
MVVAVMTEIAGNFSRAVEQRARPEKAYTLAQIYLAERDDCFDGAVIERQRGEIGSRV